MEAIKGFFDKYRFLSNFYPAPFQWKGIYWKTSEHAYQAMKTYDQTIWYRISCLEKPNQAKTVGNLIILKRKDWQNVKFEIMEEVLFEKFVQNPGLAQKLIVTQDAFLEETNTWHDNCWGNCICPKCVDIEGQNHLGLQLMNLRQIIMDA